MTNDHIDSAEKSYHDECRWLRMHLIELLGRPYLGHRSWADTMEIGRALTQLDSMADGMDRNEGIGNHRERQCVDTIPTANSKVATKREE